MYWKEMFSVQIDLISLIKFSDKEFSTDISKKSILKSCFDISENVSKLKKSNEKPKIKYGMVRFWDMGS